MTSQEVASIILTPSVGGTLVNGGLLAQQAAYTAARNTNARVRLAAATTAVLLVSHRANIRRLMDGSERKLGRKDR